MAETKLEAAQAAVVEAEQAAADARAALTDLVVIKAASVFESVTAQLSPLLEAYRAAGDDMRASCIEGALEMLRRASVSGQP